MDMTIDTRRRLSRGRRAARRPASAIGQAMVGQAEVVEQVLIALVASGHVLIEGVPGLGKTLLVRALAQALSLAHARVQFTPDMMPSDITGHAVLDPATQRAAHRPRPGLHAHPARRRDQSRAREDAERAARSDAGVPGHARRPDAAAAEAVHGAGDAEPGRDRRHVSAAGSAARSVPVQDRDRLSAERGGSRRRGARHDDQAGDELPLGDVRPCLDARAVVAPAAARRATQRVDEQVVDYAVRIVRATREHVAARDGQRIARRARAGPRRPRGRRCSTAASYVTPDDVKRIALPALRHRVALAPDALLEGTHRERRSRGSDRSAVAAPRT